MSDTHILPAQPPLHPHGQPPASTEEKDSPTADSEKSSLSDKSSFKSLAPPAEPASPGDAILRYLRLRKRRAVDDLDAVATRESVYDSPLAAYYQPRELSVSLPLVVMPLLTSIEPDRSEMGESRIL